MEDSNQQQTQHGLEPSCNNLLISPQQYGAVHAINAAGWNKAFSSSPPDKLCSSSSSTSSKAGVMPEAPSAADFYQQPAADASLDAADQADETLMVQTPPELAAWQAGRLLLDDSSLRCLLPTPPQRLSLSLCKTKASDTCRLQQQQLQQQSLLQESQFFPAQLGTAPASTSSAGFCSSNAHQYYCLRNSKYLAPAQELLNEFCCSGLKVPSINTNNGERPNNKLPGRRQSEEEAVFPSQRHRLLLSRLDVMELKKRMAKLVSMLEELDRRYRKYCEQMKALVSSLEAVAGEGAARVYSASASKAMSRHFRCLRDGIVGQIGETRNAIGDQKDPAIVPTGMTSGETPRLRLLVRYIRQQNPFQRAGGGAMEAHPWRPQRGLPERAVSVLRAWLFEHFLHPYPSDVDKHILARQTGLSKSQVCNWFINARVRLWKPMVEEMYSEETKDRPAVQAAHMSTAQEADDRRQSPNPNHGDVTQSQDERKKPGATLLDGSVVVDAGSLSSVVGSCNHKSPEYCREAVGGGGGNGEARFPGSRSHQHDQPQAQLARPDNKHFGVLDVHLSSAGECSGGGQQNFASSSSAVSLTLGLQQQNYNGAGMSFSFIPTSQSSLLFSKEAIDGYQPMQFSILDGDVQNPPYI